MSHKDVVTNDPRFSTTVTDGAFVPITGVPGSKDAEMIADDTATPRLIECNPVLYFGQSFKHYSGVVGEVLRELLFVEKAAVSLVELIGKVPVVQSDEWGDTILEKVINKFDIMIDPLLVDWVVSAAERDDSGPGDRESIGHSTGLL